MGRDLKGKVLLITGASSGIGAATALRAAGAGVHLVLAARRTERLIQIARQAQSMGVRALPLPCDVDRDEDVTHLVNAAVNEFGALHFVFANAGYGLFAPVLATSDAQARALFETNFWGTIRLLRAATPILLRNPAPDRGHVLICSSAASEIALPMYSFYSATKAAQDSIAGALRAELKSKGIRVTSVHPIGTRTEFFDRASDGKGLNTPHALLQDPSHVARKIVACLRRPRPEVWGSLVVRTALGLTTACPSLGAFVMRRIYRRHRNTDHPAEVAS